MHYFVSPEWLKEHYENQNVRVVDCRFKLGEGGFGKRQYEQCHIPGAVYFDLEKDLSGTVQKHGGRHPLPESSQLKKRIEEAGIEKDTVLVAYDAKEGAFASRFWWLMNYSGHQQVYILNGGFEAWEKAGYPVDRAETSYEKTEYTISENKEMLASYDEVRKIALEKSGDAILIDSRESRRYLGIEEHIDRIAGHIPTAINKPWMEGMENGYFKSPAEQEKRFADLDKERPVIVYCGSGVTATPNYLALKAAGFKNVRLYPGSYSDWVSYEENPVEKGE
ncbi:sulfurtransferase [Mesobacillus subterraneus]|uniref:Sulfurtransferase n=1 Tax=Mesobacillus subterraneus TaxID=285983 RepID=A0A3R9FF26_9BACI|nr:sulfurtransferase [Mesobacillus subterraneus]RSD26560.1 sulfurtransferase [Mesobacillus subterraneus]